MSDPLTLTVLGAGLPAAFTYLFQHLDRVVARRRARQDDGDGGAAEGADAQEESIAVPDCLDGDPGVLTPDLNLADELADELDRLDRALSYYARDTSRLSPTDARLAQDLGALRAALEGIYGTRLTFRGESREATGVRVRMNATDIEGKVTGTKMVSAIPPSFIDVDMTVRGVKENGEVIGGEYHDTGHAGGPQG